MPIIRTPDQHFVSRSWTLCCSYLYYRYGCVHSSVVVLEPCRRK